MTESEVLLNDIRAKLKSLIMERKKRAIINVLIQILRDPYYDDISKWQFYDLVGEVLCEDPEFFIEKLYSKFHKNMNKIFPFSQMFEMEKYIIEKYSFFKEEKFLISFKGKVIQKNSQVVGRVYLTNYRLFAHGKFGPTPASSLAAAGAGIGAAQGSVGSSGSYAAASMGVNDIIQKNLQKRLQKIMAQSTSLNNPCFGYQYPIFDSYKKLKGKKSIKYRADLEYEKKGKMKKMKLKIKVVPKKEYNENTSKFNARRIEILSILEKALNQEFF